MCSRPMLDFPVVGSGRGEVVQQSEDSLTLWIRGIMRLTKIRICNRSSPNTQGPIVGIWMVYQSALLHIMQRGIKWSKPFIPYADAAMRIDPRPTSRQLENLIIIFSGMHKRGRIIVIANMSLVHGI